MPRIIIAFVTVLCLSACASQPKPDSLSHVEKSAAAPPIQPITGHESSAESVSFASADGTRLHGSLFRAEHPVAGLLLVHGMQSHAGWFEAAGTADELTAARITCLAYDRRGSGRSGGKRGHAASPDDMLEDLDAAYQELKNVLLVTGSTEAPIHVLANCFGTRIVLPYAAEHPDSFRTIVLTAPATHMSARADYGKLERLGVLLSPRTRRMATPLKDEYFISKGPWLQWIENDPYALREVTAGFLKSSQRLTKRMNRAADTVTDPLLVVLGQRDMMVNNEKIKKRFVANYPGPVEVVEYDEEHYIDFTAARPEFARDLTAFLLKHSAVEGKLEDSTAELDMDDSTPSDPPAPLGATATWSFDDSDSSLNTEKETAHARTAQANPDSPLCRLCSLGVPGAPSR